MMNKILFVHALSPLHAGTGQAIGAVDLSIARDRATGFPYLPGSSLKGSLRARAQEHAHKHAIAAFGPDTANASDHAGMLVFGDANLLLMPVRSIAGTFAYVTSPYLLARFARDCRDVGLSGLEVPPLENGEVSECRLVSDEALKVDNRVVLEDFDLSIKKPAELRPFAEALGRELFPNDAQWRKRLINRLCVVHDDVMTFLSEHATDIVTRVSLDHETKTAADSQLWTEENLPSESILVSLLSAMPIGKKDLRPADAIKLIEDLSKEPIQLGGKATVGRGRCRLVLSRGAK